MFNRDLEILTLLTNSLTPWPESTRELYRPSDRRLSAKLMPTFADIECHVVSVTDLDIIMFSNLSILLLANAS
jgi:hypothetical protein